MARDGGVLTYSCNLTYTTVTQNKLTGVNIVPSILQ